MVTLLSISTTAELKGTKYTSSSEGRTAAELEGDSEEVDVGGVSGSKK